MKRRAETSLAKRKLRYISSFSVGTLHGMINRALLEMLLDEDRYDVECYVPGSAEQTLKAAEKEGHVRRWHRIFVNSGAGRLSMLFRYLLSAFHNVRILLGSCKDDILFYNFNNVFSLRLIDFVNRILKRNVVICCHGEMEYLANASKHSRLYKRLMVGLTCGYFNRNRIPAPGMRFIVFGDVIRDNLKEYLSPDIFSKVYSIDHPVIPGSKFGDREEREAGACVNVGLVGIVNEYKGADLFPALAESFRTDDRIRLYAIGHFQCDPEPFRDAGIIVPDDPSRPLPDDEFRRAVENLDFLLFLYPSYTYRLIASGAILDCLRFRRPVIGIRTDYFDYLFRKFGTFGYLAEDMNGLRQLLKDAGSLRRDFPFERIAEELSPAALSLRLNEIINPDCRE